MSIPFKNDDRPYQMLHYCDKHGKRVKLEDVMRRPTKDSAHA